MTAACSAATVSWSPPQVAIPLLVIVLISAALIASAFASQFARSEQGWGKLAALLTFIIAFTTSLCLAGVVALLSSLASSVILN